MLGHANVPLMHGIKRTAENTQVRIREVLENHFHDMQDFEFTIQDRTVYMLQTRNGKRTGVAAFRIACEMVEQGLIDWKTAVRRIPADQVDQLLTPIFDREAIKSAKVLTRGLPAGPGAATGRIYLNAERCVEAADRGEKVLLVRLETSPEDLRGMIAAEGILTARGGVSSHAALVARQMGKVCVCGADEIIVDYNNRTVSVGDVTVSEGDYLSIDGTSGLVYAGKVETSPSEIIQVLISKTMKPEDSRTYQNFAKLMQWCDDCTKMKVRTNADSPKQTETAIAFGATGIGLCRTEHMFFEGDRIDFVREMILSTKKSDRVAAVSKLLPYQKGDFKGIFKALKGLPGTIRLLDPPLHEFLPQTKEQQLDLAQKIGMPVEVIMRRVSELHEFNPMLGHRGCRLGIAYPEITEMQARAIFEAAVEVSQEEGFAVVPEIMVPLVAFKKELDIQKAIIDKVAQQVFEEKGAKVDYLVGTMIEIPRAAVTADEIAETAQFFSFGTNDLTQTGLGMSRDDSGSFLPQYQELEIIKKNVFASIDQLPEAQLDRFLFKVLVTYPTREEELQVLDLMASSAKPPETSPVTTPEQVAASRDLVNQIYIDDAVRGYIVDLVRATRFPETVDVKLRGLIRAGASPRATINLALAARANAFMHHRSFVTPQDIKDLAHDILRHRILLSYEAEAENISTDDVIDHILTKVPVP